MTGQQTIGARLKQARRQLAARENRDVTQAEVAAAVGVSAVQISRYESDLQEPSVGVIARLAVVLGVSPSYLAFGDAGNDPGGAAAPPAHPPAQPIPPEMFRPVPEPTQVKRPFSKRRKRGA